MRNAFCFDEDALFVVIAFTAADNTTLVHHDHDQPREKDRAQHIHIKHINTFIALKIDMALFTIKEIVYYTFSFPKVRTPHVFITQLQRNLNHLFYHLPSIGAFFVCFTFNNV